MEEAPLFVSLEGFLELAGKCLELTELFKNFWSSEETLVLGAIYKCFAQDVASCFVGFGEGEGGELVAELK
jgi:hypothetical protein